MAAIFRMLEERGFIAQVSDESLPDILTKSRFTVYAGFDPTADSLHLGHLVPIMALAHFQRSGHRPLMVVGGATGMVVDPGGRSAERDLVTCDPITAHSPPVRPPTDSFLSVD